MDGRSAWGSTRQSRSAKTAMAGCQLATGPAPDAGAGSPSAPDAGAGLVAPTASASAPPAAASSASSSSATARFWAPTMWWGEPSDRLSCSRRALIPSSQTMAVPARISSANPGRSGASGPRARIVSSTTRNPWAA